MIDQVRPSDRPSDPSPKGASSIQLNVVSTESDVPPSSPDQGNVAGSNNVGNGPASSNLVLSGGAQTATQNDARPIARGNSSQLIIKSAGDPAY